MSRACALTWPAARADCRLLLAWIALSCSGVNLLFNTSLTAPFFSNVPFMFALALATARW